MSFGAFDTQPTRKMNAFTPVERELRKGLNLLMLILRDLSKQPTSYTDGRDILEEIVRSITKALAMVVDLEKMDHDGQGDRRTCGVKRGLLPLENLSPNHKIRKCNSNVRRIFTGKPNEDDGHVWKKYGQKTIQGTKHPRSYYICSQRDQQGCEAKKQVQRTNHDSSMFVVTYIGKHTCRKAIHFSEPNNYDEGFPCKNRRFISFASNNDTSTTKRCSPSARLANFNGILKKQSRVLVRKVELSSSSGGSKSSVLISDVIEDMSPSEASDRDSDEDLNCLVDCFWAEPEYCSNL